jgi:hypothetical protein
MAADNLIFYIFCFKNASTLNAVRAASVSPFPDASSQQADSISIQTVSSPKGSPTSVSVSLLVGNE